MTIPDELRRGAPRHVIPTTQGWKRIAAFCVNIVLVIAVTSFRVTDSTPRWTGWALRSVILLLVAIIASESRIRRQHRILINGRVTVARMTGDSTPWWWRSVYRRPPMRRLECEFPLLSGGLCRTTVETYGKAPAMNSEMIVVYDPDDPEEAVLYPSLLLKVAVRRDT